MANTYTAAWAAGMLAIAPDDGDIADAVYRLNPYDAGSWTVADFMVERGLRFTDAPEPGDTIVIHDETPYTSLSENGKMYRYAVRRPPSRDLVVGGYTILGTNFDGSAYKGIVSAIPGEGARLRLIWGVGGNESRGFGLLRDGRLSVSFKLGERSGVGQFVVADDASVSGVWTLEGSAGTGSETWTPRPAEFLHRT